MSIPEAPAPPPKKRFGVGTPVVLLIGFVLLVGAFFAYTKATDRSPPTAGEVAASFVPLDELSYEEMPAGSMEPLEEAFATTSTGAETVAHFDARQVIDGTQPVAVVFVLSVDPDHMEGGFEDTYESGFAEQSQATVEDLEVGDTTGHIAETPLGTIAFFFDPDGFVFNVVGRDRPTVSAIAVSLEAGNS